MRPFLESVVDEAALEWLSGLGCTFIPGEVCAPDGPAPERHAFREALLTERLTHAVARLSPGLPPDAVHDAVRKVTLADAPSLVERNRAVHKMLVDGIDVEHRRADGSIDSVRAHLVDFDNPDNNDWLAINQFTVMDGQHDSRPDIVIFVNGLPLAVIELKNAADKGATIWSAFNHPQTHQAQIPALFASNAALVISDGPSELTGAVDLRNRRQHTACVSPSDRSALGEHHANPI